MHAVKEFLFKVKMDGESSYVMWARNYRIALDKARVLAANRGYTRTLFSSALYCYSSLTVISRPKKNTRRKTQSVMIRTQKLRGVRNQAIKKKQDKKVLTPNRSSAKKST